MKLSKLKSVFMDLKIKYKLLIAMMGIVLFICYNYFSHYIKQETTSETERALTNTAASLNSEINLLYKDISYMVSNVSFVQMATDINHDRRQNYAIHYNAIYPLLLNVITHNPLTETVLITGKNGDFFCSSGTGLKYRQEITTILNGIIHEKGISWSPSISTPFPGMADENVPITFPITLGIYGNAPLITNENDASAVTITVLIPTHALNEYLNNFNRNRWISTFLALEDGTILNLPESYSQLHKDSETLIINHIASASSLSTTQISTLDGDFFVSVKPLPFNRLKLVSTVSKKELLSGLEQLKSFTLVAVSASLLFSLFIGLALARTLTLPLKKLTENVSMADPSKPLPMFHAKYQDEIGILSRSFDHLLTIIKQQMEQLKEDEQQRYQAELESLTHQINPHFLYNTLECIHWEILGGSQENAALMVEKLGDFLRLGLKNRGTVTTIRDELCHVEKYIDIMNHRTQEPIELLVFVNKELEDYPIVPRILQPLAENSIKHGFTSQDGERIVMNPVISIRITKDPDFLVLEMEDNGQGIDISAATTALHQKDSTSKIGLNNVYKRLQVFYQQEIHVVFSSTPFHKNTITFFLPIKIFSSHKKVNKLVKITNETFNGSKLTKSNSKRRIPI